MRSPVFAVILGSWLNGKPPVLKMKMTQWERLPRVFAFENEFFQKDGYEKCLTRTSRISIS